MTIRLAVLADAPALLRIYAQSIHTPVTFETELPPVREFEGRIRETMRCYPYLVCETDGGAVGYAYAHRFRERPAYRWGAELSVYVDQSHQSRGIGKKLYAALTAILRLQNVKTVYGCVTLPNPGSEALHSSLGFRTVGVFRNSGYKCGRWHDVVWYEKQLGPYQDAPPEPVPLDEVDCEDLLSRLNRAAQTGV